MIIRFGARSENSDLIVAKHKKRFRMTITLSYFVTECNAPGIDRCRLATQRRARQYPTDRTVNNYSDFERAT